jgi:hypothetical protein
MQRKSQPAYPFHKASYKLWISFLLRFFSANKATWFTPACLQRSWVVRTRTPLRPSKDIYIYIYKIRVRAVFYSLLDCLARVRALKARAYKHTYSCFFGRTVVAMAASKLDFAIRKFILRYVPAAILAVCYSQSVTPRRHSHAMRIFLRI